MIFILNKHEKVINFLKNGGNGANPFYDDLLTEDLTTGAETFTFSTIAQGNLSKDLVVGNFVAFKKDGKYKLFQIMQVTSVHEEEMEITVYCECAGLSLTNKVYRARKIPSATFRKFLESVVEDTDWNVGLMDVRLTDTLDLDLEDSTAYSTLQNNLVNYGAEIEFRVEIESGNVTKKYIDAFVERGKKTGKTFRFGSDIEGITKTIDSTNLCTALIGKGKDGITFKDVTVSGIDKPLGQDYVADQESYQLYNRNGYHLTGIFEFDTDSPEELLRETYKELQKVKEPQATYDVQVALLGHLLDREWEKVSIGDYIGIADMSFNPPLMLMARVSKLETSFTNPQSDKCTLTNFVEVTSNISDSMRKIASELEGYVESKFPVGSEDIKEGAVNGSHMDNSFMSQVTADIVKASLVEAEKVIANEIQASEGRFENIVTDKITASEGRFQEIVTNEITASEGRFENLVVEKISASEGRFENLVAEKVEAIDAEFESVNAEIINTNKIVAGLGEFDTVIADKVEAVEGEFSQLKADVIQANNIIAGKVEAVEGEFGSLKSEVVEANRVIANKVEAVEGEFGSIKATVGDINTIISGNISSENIQTGGITGDNLNMDTIFVEDANIINVNASKINTGEINTNKVTIQSENGGILIADNTQQFKDKDGKVRVQIGQDAKGDFNFGVFDSTGTGVLIDATGVKEKALADGIIKDRMIGQGEIGGDKVDINSLITEVNKDSNTTSIKGSKILLDTEGQKLDVAFNTLKSNVNNIEVGGRNLLYKYLRAGGATKKIDDLTIQVGTSNSDTYFYLKTTNEIVKGETYTLSCEAKNVPSGCSWVFGIRTQNSANKLIINKNGKCFAVFTMDETIAKDSEFILDDSSGRPSTPPNITLKNFKLEKGNKATDYTPAPEDVDSKIESNTTAISVAQGKINTLIQDTTIEKDGQSLKLKDEYSKLEQTVSGFKTTIGQQNTTITEIGKKVDNAESIANSANNKIDNLQVGGRNILKNSNKIYLTGSDYPSVTKRENGKITVLSSGNFNAYTWVHNNFSTSLSDLTSIIGKNFTMSVDIRTTNLNNDNVRFSFDYRGSGKKQSINSVMLDKDKNGIWYRVSTTFETIDVNYPQCLLAVYSDASKDFSGLIIEYKNWKIEEGNKATNYTVAPEDVDSAINGVTSDVSNLSGKVTTVENNYSTLSQDLSGFKTTVGNTYSTKSELSTVDGKVTSLTSRVGTAESSITQLNNKIALKVEASDISTAVNNVQIGGRNYVLKSDTYITGNTSKDFNYSILQELKGKTVTLSIEVDLNSVVGSRVGFEPSIVYADGSVQYLGVWQSIKTSTTMKQRISATYTIQNKEISRFGQIGMYIQGVTSGTARIGRPKMEIGTKATDWTPAPEDVDSSINNAQTNAVNSAKSYTDGQISTVNQTITNKVAEIKLTTDSITQRVSSTESTINNLQIGGRNLAPLVNIKDYAGGGLSNNKYYSVSGTKITATNQPLNSSLIGFKVYTDNTFTYTFSGNTNLSSVAIYFRCYNSSDTIVQAQVSASTTVTNGKFTITFSNIPSSTYYFNIGIGNTGTANYYIDKLKLEKGNKATDYTPAPEDVQASIDLKANSSDVYTKTQTDSAIKVAKDNINLSVSQTYETKTNVSSLANSTLTSAKSYADTKKNEAIVGARTIPDTRSTNQNPQWYMTNYPKQTITEFKYANVVGIGSSAVFGSLETKVPWGDSSGGYPVQIFRSNSTATYERKGTSTTAWGAWTQVEDTSGAQNKANSALTSAKSYADTKKTEAINSANATTDTKLQSYSTTTQMNSAINVAKNEINLGVSKVEQIASSSLQAKMLYVDPTFKSGSNSVGTYNNAGGGTVTVSRVEKSSDCPTTSGYMLQIKTTGSASPGHGGFYFATQTRANAIFITKIIAKIPSGCYLNWASNATGTGGKSEWLTSNAGTGNWKEYIYKVTCGSSGTFSSTNFYYLSGGSVPITWYVAMATVFDITETSNIESRLSSAETKITPSSILSSVNTQIGAGGQINTVSTILDKTGFTVKNGALKVQNNAGQTVLGADSSGNLWVQNSMAVGGNTNGIINVNNSSGATIFSANKDGIRVKDAVMSVTSGTISGGGISYPSGAKHVNVIGSKGIESRSTTVSGSQQYDNMLTCTTDKIQIYSDNSANALGTHNMSVLTPTSIALQSGTTAGSMPDIFRVTSSALTYNGNTLNSNGFYCQSWLRTYGATGWYSQTYGGGWYMSDTTWIRSYGSKNVYINATLRADGGLQVGGSGTGFVVNSVGALVTTSSMTVNEAGKQLIMGCGAGDVYFKNSKTGLYLQFSDDNTLKISGNTIGDIRYPVIDRDTQRWYQRVAPVMSDGVMEIGKYIDFHDGSPNGADYNVRLTSYGSTLNTSGAFTQNSDGRLKEDIVYFDDKEVTTFQSEELSTKFKDFIKNDFRPCSFRYKNTQEKLVGFIAQDVANTEIGKLFTREVNAEIIDKTKKDGETIVGQETHLTFDLSGYTTIVAKALQEEIIEKDQKIADLESRLENLEKIVKDLLNK